MTNHRKDMTMASLLITAACVGAFLLWLAGEIADGQRDAMYD
jgi:hypothetical protein